MNTEEYVEAIDEMDSDTLKQNFEALMVLGMGDDEDEGEEDS